MQSIFRGLLLVLLDFTVSFENGAVLGLLPDFIGFFLIYRGLKQMVPESGHFAKARPWALGLGVYCGVLYAMDLLAVSAAIEIYSWVLGCLGTAAGLYVTYCISRGVQETEACNSFDLNGGKLFGVWVAVALSQILAAVLVWVPVANIFATFSTLVTAIVYLTSFHQSRKLYALMIS